jgi:hypothetical protein
MFIAETFMSARSLLLLLSITLCHSANAETYARFNDTICSIDQYANVSKYMGKGYKILPKEFLDSGPSGGNVKYHTIWDSGDDTLKYFDLPGKHVNGISFDVYKKQIVSVAISFSDESIESGVVDINQLMNSCGKRMSQDCSAHNKDVELIIKNKKSITVQYSRAMAIMYGYPRKYYYPCASLTE